MMHLEGLKTQSAADLYTNGCHACRRLCLCLCAYKIMGTAATSNSFNPANL